MCVALIGVAGSRLIRYGDALAALTGLSRGWIGLIMVATVTSLPELVTGLSAVTLAASPDIAVGDALGSCVFNLAVLALVDVFHRRRSVYAVASPVHILSAWFGALLLAIVALALLPAVRSVLPAVGHVGAVSIVIALAYGVAMRAMYRAEQRTPRMSEPAPGALSFKEALTGYALTSMVIVGSGTWLPMIGVELARQMGWSNSFVGTLFVAFATSVPELATTWAALRIGAVDMAVANLLGSNLFDVLILAIDDLAYAKGSLLAQVSPLHAASALSACLMSGAVAVAMAQRPASRVLRGGSWASTVLLALYLLNAVFQYRYGH